MKRLLVAFLGLATALPQAARAQCPDGSPPPCRGAARPTPSPASVAVLYFDNASRDSADAYLAEGLTEAIITQLGRVERLSVKSRSSVRRFRGGDVPDPPVIGRTLGVAYLVTGSVQRAGHRLRVTIDMARTATGVRVWGNQFVRSDDSLFALQDDIAGRVAEGVAGRLLPAERRAVAAARTTRNPEAYDHFLRGNHYLAQRTSTGMLRATAEYRRAAALDSGFVSALARVGLAYALRLDYAWDSTGASPADSLLERGMAAADQALRRDSLNSDAWLARGFLLQFRNPRTFEGVMEGLKRAVALDASNAEAWHLLAGAADRIGDDSTAVTAWRRALALDPARPITLWKYAQYVAPAEGEQLLDSALAVDPGFLQARYLRARLRLGRGDTAGARRDIDAARCEACPADMWPRVAALHAGALLALGDTAAARAEAELVLARLRPAGGLSLDVALLLAGTFLRLGDSAKALDLIERAELRGVWLWSSQGNFSPLETNPRFRRLLADARPPWAPPEPEILDLPIPAAARARWEGTYAGPLGGRRVLSRGDSLILGDQSGELGRLLYQGGDTLVGSWDHAHRYVFDSSGDRAPGFTLTVRKRVFPYKRVTN